MNRLRAPILVDMAGLLIIATIWAAALLAPLHANARGLAFVAGEYCGNLLPADDGSGPDIGAYHHCCPTLFTPPLSFVASASLQTHVLVPFWQAETFVFAPAAPTHSIIRGPPGCDAIPSHHLT